MNQHNQYQHSSRVGVLSGVLIALILAFGLLTVQDANAFSGGHWCKKDQLNVSPCWPHPPEEEVHNVPVPGSVWLLGGGLIILGVAKRFRRG